MEVFEHLRAAQSGMAASSYCIRSNIEDYLSYGQAPRSLISPGSLVFSASDQYHRKQEDACKLATDGSYELGQSVTGIRSIMAR